ncbi:MAG TPA: hypothetical protein DEP84_05140 [Chloroflexi bacterium]|nr:hypothetical protein [Chloroflexota bacterium]
MFDELDLSTIEDERLRELVARLLNLGEQVTTDRRAAQAEIQRLRDEINRLKGEQGRPDIKAKGSGGSGSGTGNSSSEKKRFKPKGREGRSKIERLEVTREEIVVVDRAQLPGDAEFKGYEEVTVQDVCLEAETIRFRKEKFYSPGAQRTYLAELPTGYEGQFGPGIRALVVVWYFASTISEPKILELLHSLGVAISAGEVSNMVIKEQDAFHSERAEAFQAGLESSPWHHHDQTSTRVAGDNQSCQITCHPLDTNYHTTERKDRPSVVQALMGGQPLSYRFNAETFALLEQRQVSVTTRSQLQLKAPQDVELDEASLQAWLDQHGAQVGAITRQRIADAAAVAAYHAQTEWPVIRLLVGDDAPQFNLITEELALCWIHEGRHSTKLTPLVAHHRLLVEHFCDRFWNYSDELLAYRQHPTLAERQRLEAAFDTLFATRTGYWALDDRMARTRQKKQPLLMVLEHPEISLHNNPAELGARARVRKREVSFGPRTRDGTAAWDTFQSLAATTKKLGLNFIHYVRDRIAGANTIPRLADLIRQQATELNLGASWPSG